MTDPDRRTLERTTYDAWPRAALALFDGDDLAGKAGFTASLVVVDRSNDPPQPRTTLLSAGELYAPDARTLRFSLWPQSRAARALAVHPDATLAFVADDAFHQARLHIDSFDSSDSSDDRLARFTATLVGGEAQRVGYARLTSGIAFELAGADAPAVLARWARQIAQLRR
ncbi:putative vanillate decarboxylase VdcD protein [Burkholderia thailandensis MSMB121]|uniref:Uncharacterized protein n=2 Tax=Burkholderia humptydooensis TaxID=430531 RepID=A0A7U4STD2_9BURK|nr:MULTISPECIES: hypothetical protein [Burkholderia]AGK48139.1 putative vanillate decarboxylase VdcD protein [Burkholderia thailandensis MSMB121]ATF34782.1 hypothetical protein CO709_16080 [Burkholderia thailandensis]AJY44069.1 putative vanillate decarboxylase VdcD protein [Burkholderia sp. 2002721687]ALX43666.1 hypothetical protein AQ610_15490 [Burkholderia humptydooensis]EIP90017.1 hypothetical protein A33K_13601 [Burkholderia humptydooensis MSMB43]